MTRRPTLILAALGAAALLAGCGGSDAAQQTTTTETTETTQTTETTETTTPTETEAPDPITIVRINVRGGVPVGGIARPKVGKNERVAFVVTSDVSDHVHVHGYDLFKDVRPGVPARIAFRANVPGRFEVELEDRRVPIAELTVNA
jgi:hypothetical protein